MRRARPPFPPSALPNMPMPLSVKGSGLGSVVTDKSIVTAIEDAFYYGGGGTIYIDPVNGTDGASYGSPSSPAKTLSYALRQRTERYVFLIPNAPFAPCDFDYSDVGGSYNLRMVKVAPGYENATIKAAGDDLRILTWAAVSGAGAVYQASVTSKTSNSLYAVHHVIKVDDTNGFNQPRSLPYHASLSSLQSSGLGFFYDNAARKIYVADNGSDISANRASYIALFGGAMRILGGRIVFGTGIRFDGTEFIAQESSTGSPAIVGLSGTEHRFSPGHTIHAAGGVVLSENVKTYCGAYDGWNYDLGNVTGHTAFSMEINCRGNGAGDIETYGSAGEQSRNGSSAHGGANVARYGSMYDGNFGPNINDTSINGVDNTSWNVGCLTRNSTALAENKGFASDAVTTGYRRSWLDTCQDEDAAIAGAYANGANCVVKTYVVTLNGMGEVANSSAPAISPYTPDNP